MPKLFTREQIRTWLREKNLKDGASIENAFITESQSHDVLADKRVGNVLRICRYG